MEFHELFTSSVSACFELASTTPYYAQEPYDVTLDGAAALTGVRTNIFSLFDLKPGTEYRVGVGSSELRIRTKDETACLSVRDFGAAGDGVTDDTAAIQAAVDVCPAGGRVRVGRGTYLTGPIQLKSHMTLELTDGAVLLGDPEESHWPVLPGELTDPATGEAVQISSFEGEPQTCHKSFISAYFAEDITITGRGRLDANAQNSTWWIDVKNRAIARSRLMFLNGCRQVTIHGITGCNSPAWNFHPFFSQDVSFLDMAVEAPKNSPNTDGSDPESCDGVRYLGVRFSVGDDAIAIKSGKIYMGMKYQTPASNHVIRNCLMEYAHGAVVLGSEMSGGIRDLTVSQCYFRSTDRGLRIKTRRGRGKYAVVDGVEFSNIRMDNVMTPLVLNMYYFCDADGKSEWVQDKGPRAVDDSTPRLGAFTFRDMVCTDCEWAAGFFYGLPEMPVASITIDSVRFEMKTAGAGSGVPAMMNDVGAMCRAGLIFHNVEKVTLRNVTVSGVAGDEITADGVGELVRE